MLRIEHRTEMDRLAHDRWYRSLTPAQQDREDRREAAAMQALGLALSGGGPFTPAPMPVAPRPLPLRCTSLNMSTAIYTECQ